MISKTFVLLLYDELEGRKLEQRKTGKMASVLCHYFYVDAHARKIAINHSTDITSGSFPSPIWLDSCAQNSAAQWFKELDIPASNHLLSYELESE